MTQKKLRYYKINKTEDKNSCQGKIVIKVFHKLKIKEFKRFLIKIQENKVFNLLIKFKIFQIDSNILSKFLFFKDYLYL